MEVDRDNRPANASDEHSSDAAPALGNVTADRAASEMDTETPTETTSEAASEPPAGNTQAPAKSKSGVWEHYDRLADCGEKKLVKCRYCPKQYACSNSSTGNMWKHFRKAHPVIAGIRPDPGPQGPAYTPEAFRQAITKWITTRDLPFSEVDAPEFREMVGMLYPGVQVPSASTARRDIDGRFEVEKKRVRALLQGAPGRLSFAVDAWTSPSAQAFLGITVHWIDAEWQLHSLLMDMPPLTGRHTGSNLCAAFTTACHDFGVLPKLLAVTTDSASNNGTFLGALEAACMQQGIVFDRASMHVRCIAHVINLAVQDFLRVLSSTALDSENDYDENYIPDEKVGGFIQRLRRLAVKVRESPQRRERFAHECSAAGIQPKELLVDVRTRWNSTHDMIERALDLRSPLDSMTTFDAELVRYVRLQVRFHTASITVTLTLARLAQVQAGGRGVGAPGECLQLPQGVQDSHQPSVRREPPHSR